VFNGHTAYITQLKRQK